MNTPKALEHLRTIRDAYSRIHDITAQAAQVQESRAVARAVERRKQLLSFIEHEQRALERECGGWKDEMNSHGLLRSICSDIQLLVRSIMEMDAPLKRMVELRVHALRSEIAGLNTSSHAALSYAAHAAR